MTRITKSAVDRLAASGGPADAFLWDGELTGFGGRCRPNGSKTYLLKTRIGGRARWLTIGRHGSPWTAEQARKEALRLMGEVVAGRDPAAEREDLRRAPTVAELIALYFGEGCATKKPTTIRNDRSRARCHIEPLLGPKRVRDLARADVERFQRDVAAGRTAGDRKTGPRGRSIVTGGKGTARQCMILLSAILSFAVRRGLIADNPCRGVARYQPRTMERFLSPAEQVRLGEALAAAEAAGVNPTPIAAVRLLALTGLRAGEARGLRWSEVDFEHGCLRLADSKTGYKVVRLGAAALELLAGLPRWGGAHVFPSAAKPGAPISDLSAAWERVRREAGLADVRLHDLRHSFASTVVNAGGSLPVIGALLGHRNQATTARYAHLADDLLGAVADRAAHSIGAALAGRPAAGVEPLGVRRT